MKITETKVYTYTELSPAAQEKARDWYIGSQEFDAEYVIDYAKEQAVHLGLDIDRIFYSGFSSQGDGACFEGHWRAARVNPKSINQSDAVLVRIAEAFAKLSQRYPDASFKVEHRGHYQHENCTVFDHYCGNEDERRIELIGGTESDDEDTVGERRLTWEHTYPEDEVEELARDYMRWIYSELGDAWEHQSSDEAVAENILANKYTFTEDGKRF